MLSTMMMLLQLGLVCLQGIGSATADDATVDQTATKLAQPGPVPVSSVPGVTVELFAEAPQIVTPTGIAIDEAGRVFVAESHTHFRPDDYEGPAADRILIFEDTTGDGRADRRRIFHEGFTHVMDLEFDSEGRLFVATRMDIHILPDANKDDVADAEVPVVTLQTTGTYPHNGLSGLCFNADGSLNFGLGENLGHDYTLIGSDGTKISGGGEGGSTYRVRADGRQLRRVTTGWWNPYGLCVDAKGRIFGTDNDPGASPPCRLIQVHDGADYGYEYRYGRTGLHPLISWTGELPGNLPMIAGTGEAPCDIVTTAGTNLPDGMQDDLLVACWADHRIERYDIRQEHDRGQVTATRDILITGDNEFRPVGLQVAPNGDIYVTDWVSASYQLHGKGKIWRIRTDGAKEAAAGSSDSQQPPHLRGRVHAPTNSGSKDSVTALIQQLRKGEASQSIERIRATTRHTDPLVRHIAVLRLLEWANEDPGSFQELFEVPDAAVLLAAKRSRQRVDFEQTQLLQNAFKTGDHDAWQVAVKWIADYKLESHRSLLEQQLRQPKLQVPQFLMLAAALQRLDGKDPTDRPSPQILAQMIVDDQRSIALRTAALRLLPDDSKATPWAAVVNLTRHANDVLRREAIRKLRTPQVPDAFERLTQIVAGDKPADQIEALDALTTHRPRSTELLIRHATEMPAGDHKIMHRQRAALQALVGSKLTDDQRSQLQNLKTHGTDLRPLVDRVLGEKSAAPSAYDTQTWLTMLDGPADARAGQRLFFHAAIGTCGRCHQHSGRGNAVGPALSLIARRLSRDPVQAKTWLLETILQPSKDMAPQYTPWTVVTTDGRQLTGLPRRKGGSTEAYLGIDGHEFTVKKQDIEFHQESRTSIMPEGLLQNLTEQERRDLFAFLLASE